MQEKSAVVIVAAGSSQRMGRDKLWIPLMGRITLARTLDVFQTSPLIETIVIVTSKVRVDEVRELCEQEQWRKVAGVVAGGLRRQDSVRCGLDALAELAPDTRWVMIHDAARPFVNDLILEAGLQAVQQTQATIAAMPVKDTIKQVQDETIVGTPDRASLWIVQTPQVFSFPLILAAHHTDVAQEDMTDDATLLERLGNTVTIFPGSYVNIKITTQEDILFAEAYIRSVQALQAKQG